MALATSFTALPSIGQKKIPERFHLCSGLDLHYAFCLDHLFQSAAAPHPSQGYGAVMIGQHHEFIKGIYGTDFRHYDLDDVVPNHVSISGLEFQGDFSLTVGDSEIIPVNGCVLEAWGVDGTPAREEDRCNCGIGTRAYA
ncbi:16887_t:CDS:2 [Acaulospora colombiana]|uniref:16887_t:CDS:1 n=1 Tax=Acaulospora colombiana TaxID=27376 RepID=A0ACA9NWT5_9GLOM|nr:16887_t:CDS:2 [Acaulospora colombiana]